MNAGKTAYLVMAILPLANCYCIEQTASQTFCTLSVLYSFSVTVCFNFCKVCCLPSRCQYLFPSLCVNNLCYTIHQYMSKLSLDSVIGSGTYWAGWAVVRPLFVPMGKHCSLLLAVSLFCFKNDFSSISYSTLVGNECEHCYIIL